MSTTALDLGSYSLKALSGKPGAQPKVDRFVEVLNPTGANLPNETQSRDLLAQLIDNTFHDYGLPRNDVRLALPESVVTTKVISLPPLSDAELASAIQWQAEQHIPIPAEDLSLEYQVLYRPPRGQTGEPMRVLLVGTRRKVVEAYVDVLYQIGIEPSVVETQVLSTLRSLQFTPEDPATLVLSWGAANADIAVVDQGEVAFVYTTALGSHLLTKIIAQAMQQDIRSAEEYKRRYGLDETALGGKLRQLLIPQVDLLIQEMRKAMQFYLNQRHQMSLTRAVLCGGGVGLPGLVQYLAASLGMEVLQAAPLSTASGQIPPGAGVEYCVCTGLLQREKS